MGWEVKDDGWRGSSRRREAAEVCRRPGNPPQQVLPREDAEASLWSKPGEPELPHPASQMGRDQGQSCALAPPKEHPPTPSAPKASRDNHHSLPLWPILGPPDGGISTSTDRAGPHPPPAPTSLGPLVSSSVPVP